MESCMILATDIMVDIIQGDDRMLHWLRQKAHEHELIVLTACVTEALKQANSATCRGCHALAELISISTFRTRIGHDDMDCLANPHAVITADALLASLWGRIDSSRIREIAALVPIIVDDISLVAALLCVQEGDNMDAENLAEILDVLRMRLADASKEERALWVHGLSDRFIAETRNKALAPLLN